LDKEIKTHFNSIKNKKFQKRHAARKYTITLESSENGTLCECKHLARVFRTINCYCGYIHMGHHDYKLCQQGYTLAGCWYQTGGFSDSLHNEDFSEEERRVPYCRSIIPPPPLHRCLRHTSP
jgi:hypothetical protein